MIFFTTKAPRRNSRSGVGAVRRRGDQTVGEIGRNAAIGPMRRVFLFSVWENDREPSLSPFDRFPGELRPLFVRRTRTPIWNLARKLGRVERNPTRLRNGRFRAPGFRDHDPRW